MYGGYIPENHVATSVQQHVIIIRSDLDIVTARSMARDIARTVGFGPIDQARIATAVSELALNIFLYAGTGSVTARIVEKDTRQGIEMEFHDNGPGIRDIRQVMRDDYIAPRSIWMGLPGARRFMDDFEIESHIGIGTRIVCRKWRPLPS
jgi:serine/threonine-protein kinase RsbT